MQIIKIAFIILFIILFFFENKLLIYQKYIKYILNVIDVSIIIPVYNSEKYLPLCLNSIISQTLLNIEIICINDGSTDKSVEILREYKIKDNRIIIIQQKNQGSGIARNNGIKISKGKFITFMDSDDLYPDNYTLESMFKNVILNKVLICGGGLNTFVHQNNKIKILKNVKNSFHK